MKPRFSVRASSRRHRFGARQIAFRQRGAMAVLVTLMAVVLLGFGGLVTDIGRMYIIRTELQSAMDGCALAAAAQLNGDATSLTRGALHGRAMVDKTKTASGQGRDLRYVNRLFQVGDIDPALVDVEFSILLAGPYEAPGGTVTPDNAAFVRCKYDETQVPVYLMRILNILAAAINIPANTTVSALAVATQEPSSSVACAFPVAVCRGGPAPDYGLIKGNWYGGLQHKNPPPTGYGTGNFGWIDFTPPSGGASELADIITGSGVCSLTTGVPVGESGVAASLEKAWNSRFGVYQAGGGNPQPSTAAPDFTGVGYSNENWGGSNAYPNYKIQLDSRAPYNSPVGGLGLTSPTLAELNPANPSSAATHLAFGKKRRVVTAPIVDCSAWDTGGANPTVDAFACVLLLRPITNPGAGSFTTEVEYLGLASETNSPCATSGLPGGSVGPRVPSLVQ